MPSFPKPKFTYTVNLSKEIKALRNYRNTKEGRQVPEGRINNLRIATWNIANLGAQDREKHNRPIVNRFPRVAQRLGLDGNLSPDKCGRG